MINCCEHNVTISVHALYMVNVLNLEVCIQGACYHDKLGLRLVQLMFMTQGRVSG